MKTEPGLFTMMAHPAQATQAVAGPRGGLATARSRFILCITFGYLVFALGWILLSDQLLSAFSDLAAMVWLSTAKGLLFVAASSAVFFCALHAVPPARSEPGDTLLGALTAGIAAGRHSRWLTYGFAITVSVAMLCMRQGMGSGFSARPLLILLDDIGPCQLLDRLAETCAFEHRSPAESQMAFHDGPLKREHLCGQDRLACDPRRRHERSL